MKDLRWPHAFVIVGVLAVVAVLALLGKDSAAIVVPALAILGALGLVIKQQAENKAETAAVRENTNGTASALVALIEKQQQQLIEQQQLHQDQMMQLAEKLAGMQPLPAQEDHKRPDGEP